MPISAYRIHRHGGRGSVEFGSRVGISVNVWETAELDDMLTAGVELSLADGVLLNRSVQLCEAEGSGTSICTAITRSGG